MQGKFWGNSPSPRDDPPPPPQKKEIKKRKRILRFLQVFKVIFADLRKKNWKANIFHSYIQMYIIGYNTEDIINSYHYFFGIANIYYCYNGIARQK